MATTRGRAARRELAILIAALALILIAMAGFYSIQQTDNRDETWLQLARSVSSDVSQIVDLGSIATRGFAPDFQTLAARTEDLNYAVQTLAEGDPSLGLARAPDAVQPEVLRMSGAWVRLRKLATTITNAQEAWQTTTSATTTINTAIHADSESATDLFTQYQVIARQLSGTNATMAIDQLVRLERIASTARQILSRGRDARATAELLNADIATFTETANSLGNVGAVAAEVRSANTAFAEILTAGEQISSYAEAVESLQVAASSLQSNATGVIAASKSLEQSLLNTRVKQVVLPVVVAIAGGLAVVLLLTFIVMLARSTRARLQSAEDRDAKQQHAILSLLDEITNLADGDLTVDVTVTEDFTGAIADSINYTVQNMRNLVGTITRTSHEIAQAASSTQQAVLQMNQASERQAREVTDVTNAIGTTSQSMQQVAGSAEQLSDQARQSVSIARDGAGTVNRTILGMTALREQIQDTSKRIKRLGESSQEIGNIIEFINDIAEQTNTLALNASIQAAMAGEAGRGFAVVADEVQRLSERVGNATRQVETLVKTIQADTNEAIVSMERSTQNVVVGAKSAEEAGQALSKVETASQELSQLISEISVSARNQSAQATKIAGTMQVIRQIAVQTSGSANSTAQAVEELNVLSEQLRESVAGFKLPND